MKRKFGFTLAEVLITLSIIGVVSAMTLPTLNANVGSARNSAALKKALSTLNGAVKSPALVVAPIRVNFGKSIRSDLADGPLPIIISSA